MLAYQRQVISGSNDADGNSMTEHEQSSLSRFDGTKPSHHLPPPGKTVCLPKGDAENAGLENAGATKYGKSNIT